MTRHRRKGPCQVMVWDDAAVARLGEMRAAGHTMAEIGAALGVSRNAVAGAVMRYLPGLPAGLRPLRDRPARVPKPRVPKASRPEESCPTAPARAPRAAPDLSAQQCRDAAAQLEPSPRLGLARHGFDLAGAQDAGFAHAVDFLDRRGTACVRPLWGCDDTTGLVCGAPTGDAAQSYCKACRAVLFAPRPVKSGQGGFRLLGFGNRRTT